MSLCGLPPVLQMLACKGQAFVLRASRPGSAGMSPGFPWFCHDPQTPVQGPCLPALQMLTQPFIQGEQHWLHMRLLLTLLVT